MKRSLVLLVYIVAIAIMAIAQQAPEVRWASIDGQKIRYYDIGDTKAKNALVLVHCWTCNADFWKDTYNAFPDYRVVAMDLPGHGESDKPKIDYSMEFFARSVDAVMKHAGVKKAVLAGHSMGSPVIRRYYELYPSKTLGLVIVDGSMIPYANREELEKFFEPFYKDYKSEAPKFIEDMLPKDAALASYIKSSMLATPEHVATSAMRLMTDDSYAEHGKIGVPALAVMAPSPYWPPDLEAKYRAIMPRLEYQMWPGTSHFLQMERPAWFNGQVKGFIIRNGLL
ncbi:MAG TPA: alpha/beta hydrolase [Pyrinomonadaceae bacterium]